MNLTTSMQQLASALNARLVEYTSEINLILVPVTSHRYQAVVGQLVEKNRRAIIEFSSKVCELCANRENHQIILRLNQELFYSKVIIHEDQLRVTAECLADQFTDQLMSDMITEVATVAYGLDHQEISAETSQTPAFAQ